MDSSKMLQEIVERREALRKDSDVYDLITSADKNGVITYREEYYPLCNTLAQEGYITPFANPIWENSGYTFKANLTASGWALRCELTKGERELELALIRNLNHTFETLLSDPQNYPVINPDVFIRIWQDQLADSAKKIFAL